MADTFKSAYPSTFAIVEYLAACSNGILKDDVPIPVGVPDVILDEIERQARTVNKEDYCIFDGEDIECEKFVFTNDLFLLQNFLDRVFDRSIPELASEGAKNMGELTNFKNRILNG